MRLVPTLRLNIIFSLVFFFLLLTSCRPSPGIPSQEDVLSLGRVLDSNRRSPAEMIVSRLGAVETPEIDSPSDNSLKSNSPKSPVFIQTNPLRAEYIDMMMALYPSLYDAGYHELGVYFIRSTDQDELDELIGYSSVADATMTADPISAPEVEAESDAGAGADAETDSGTEVGDDAAAIPTTSLPAPNDMTSPNPVELASRLLFNANHLFGYREYVDFLLSVGEFNSLLPEGHPPLRIIGLSELSPVVGSAAMAYWLQAEDLGDIEPVESRSTDRNSPDSNSSSSSTAELARLGLNREQAVFIALHGPDRKAFRWNGLIEQVTQSRPLRDRSFAFESSDPAFPGWDLGWGDNNAPGFPVDIYVVAAFPYQSVSPIDNFINGERVEKVLTRLKSKSAIRRNIRSYKRQLKMLRDSAQIKKTPTTD